MSTSQGDILRLLTLLIEPADIKQLARELDTIDLGGLVYQLNDLVRRQQVKRHQGADGVVRYAIPTSAPTAATAPAQQTESDRRSVVQRVRALLAEATQPITAAEACDALPDAEPAAVRNALYGGVHHKHFVSIERPGKQTKAFALAGRFEGTVTATATATASVTASADEADDQPASAAPRTAPVKGIALHEMEPHDAAVLLAEMALDAYVFAHVDRNVYEQLKASVDAAQTARKAHRDRRAAP